MAAHAVPADGGGFTLTGFLAEPSANLHVTKSIAVPSAGAVGLAGAAVLARELADALRDGPG